MSSSVNPGAGGKNDKASPERKEFLFKMYDQMFNDINRHLSVIWQSVGVVAGSFAIFALAEKGVLTKDAGTALIVIVSGWLLAHVYDASYWYNRNLVIIANIERQFLLDSDLEDIHYYFGEHRPENKMITHLRIQRALGVGIGVAVLALHFSESVLPSLSADNKFAPMKLVPYILAVVVTVYVWHVNRHTRESYREFLRNSPGKWINAAHVSYGVGHGFNGPQLVTHSSAEKMVDVQARRTPQGEDEQK